ncbi:small conductance mechanosensitive channel [Anaeromicropila populeti]|uniref:Small conductance mechanosensitive channel n=2 Tax=Anaeromicropila populeti TaxID=37658 RepID=A0A1I6IQQ0_9FIRM|nr:small conductance mechanosensitive channel [Anaeromicropila populeti]
MNRMLLESSIVDSSEALEQAKEKVQVSVDWFNSILPDILKVGKSLLIALVVFFIGKKVINWLLRLVEKSLERSNVDTGITKFLISFSKVVATIVLLVTIIAILGLPTTSFVALIGSAGVTIGLALQGSLSNFAGGVLILVLKPFRVGDYIIAAGNEGTVSGIDIFYTKLLTIDNKVVVIPNGSLANSNIVNVTAEPVRRLDLIIPIEYSENIKRVKDVLFQEAMNHQLVLKEDYQIDIYVSSFEASSISLGLRMWVNTDNYWKLKCEILENIRERFAEENIFIPFNQLDVIVKRE